MQTGRIILIDIGHDHPEGRHRAEKVERIASAILTSKGFDGHTVTHGAGYWQGDYEPQTTVRVYLTGGGSDDLLYRAIDAVREAAAEIRDTLSQDAVGFTVTRAEVEFV